MSQCKRCGSFRAWCPECNGPFPAGAQSPPTPDTGTYDDAERVEGTCRRCVGKRVVTPEEDLVPSAPNPALVSLMAYGKAETDSALRDKRHEDYKFWSGWVMALERLDNTLSRSLRGEQEKGANPNGE